MKFNNPVCVNVLSPLALRQPAELLDSIETFLRSLSCVTPEKWGWSEPLNRDFDAHDLRALAPEGTHCETVYWKRKKRPKAEGAFAVRWSSKSPRVLDTHSNINFATELGQIDQVQLVQYLKASCVRARADIGLIDVLSAPYREFAIESGSAPFGERCMVVTHLLRHWLPDVFWATVFGPAYVRLFGKERLLNAPAYLVEELGPDTIYIQLTELLADTVNKATELQLCRDRFKEHIGCKAFFIHGEGYDRLQRGPVGDVFSVPNFELIGD